MSPNAFLLLALWPLVCCGNECQSAAACIGISVLLALAAFLASQLIRELWLLRVLRDY